jgi:hypothetical protein
MRRRIVLGGWAFKLGLLAWLWFLLAPAVLGGAWDAARPYGVVIASLILVAGILATATRNPSHHLEISAATKER